MEKRYKIGLFFICTVILIVIILLLWKRSNENTEIKDIENTPQVQSIEKENKSVYISNIESFILNTRNDFKE